MFDYLEWVARLTSHIPDRRAQGIHYVDPLLVRRLLVDPECPSEGEITVEMSFVPVAGGGVETQCMPSTRKSCDFIR